MNHLIKFLSLIAIFSTSLFAIPVTWQNDYDNVPAEFILDSDGVTKLQAGSDGSSGDFIQLIKIISGSSVDPIDFGAVDGIDTSVHQLIDSGFIGQGLGPSFNGEFDITDSYGSVTNGDVLFLRAWNAPSPNFASNHAPTVTNGVSGAKWGNSSTYTVPPAVPSATFQVPEMTTSIPEPSTLLLLAAGILGILRVRGKFRK